MNSDGKTVREILHSVFGYKNFKNTTQKDATKAILKGLKTVCISMPSGFDRSLCFQLPVIFRKSKIAIIISSKLSTVQKQVYFLRSKQINAYLLSQKSYVSVKEYILRDLMSESPTISFLYVTLDVALNVYFQDLVQSLIARNLLYYIVFNEAHCISTLDYEYVSKYKTISLLYDKRRYDVAIIVVANIVTAKVLKDICKQFSLNRPEIFQTPVKQFNIYHDVWFVNILKNPLDHLRQFILKVISPSNSFNDKLGASYGVIYCTNEDTAELLSTKLNEFGTPTLAYYRSLKKDIKCNLINQWSSNEAKVIVTDYNYEFIYENPIKGIAYFTTPRNISQFYRESARTCSDNDRKYCRIYFMDDYLLENGFNTNIGVEQNFTVKLEEFNAVASYCLSRECRHVLLSEYFDCAISRCRTNCDVCVDEKAVGTNIKNFISYSKKSLSIEYIIYSENEYSGKKDAVLLDCAGSIKKEHEYLKDDKKKVDKFLTNYKEEPSRNKKVSGLSVLPAVKGVHTDTKEIRVVQTNGHAIRPSLTGNDLHKNSIVLTAHREKERKEMSDGDSRWQKAKKRVYSSDRNHHVFESKIKRTKIMSSAGTRIKSDANVQSSDANATAEYLMTKYGLNRDAITLVPCSKKV